eukprot:7939124-Alexandrium_andersonii.AAC.1
MYVAEDAEGRDLTLIKGVKDNVTARGECESSVNHCVKCYFNLVQDMMDQMGSSDTTGTLLRDSTELLEDF